MATLFTRIIKGEIPCYKIAENERFFAFLDIYPLKTGHTLVVPKQETDYLFDLDDELLSPMLPFCKGVASAIKKAVPCNRIGVTVIGLEVPHAHIHLIPIRTMDDMNFAKPKLKLSEEEFQKTCKAIRAHIPTSWL